MQKALFIIGSIGMGAALWSNIKTEPESSPAERWMLLGDIDNNGRLNSVEYARVSDGKTPMHVLDVNGDDSIEMDEMEGFFLGIDPIDLMNKK